MTPMGREEHLGLPPGYRHPILPISALRDRSAARCVPGKASGLEADRCASNDKCRTAPRTTLEAKALLLLLGLDLPRPVRSGRPRSALPVLRAGHRRGVWPEQDQRRHSLLSLARPAHPGGAACRLTSDQHPTHGGPTGPLCIGGPAQPGIRALAGLEPGSRGLGSGTELAQRMHSSRHRCAVAGSRVG